MIWLRLFLFGFAIDIAYVWYIRAVTRGRTLQAGMYSVLIAAPAVFGYVEVYDERILSLPYLGGLFFGTMVAMKLKERL